MKENSFTKREWILTLFLISVGWISVLIATLCWGAYSDIVSHASLASSVVSIILAVLAIIIAFNQGIIQSTQSNSISNEVIKLSTSVSQINTSTKSLEQLDNLKKLEKLKLIDTLLEKVEDNLKSTKSTEKEFVDFKKSFNIEKKEQISKLPSVNELLIYPTKINKFLDALFTTEKLAMLYIKKVHDKDKNVFEELTSLFDYSGVKEAFELKLLNEGAKLEKYERLVYGTFERFLGFINVLVSLSLIKLDSNADKVLKINEELSNYIKTINDKEFDGLEKYYYDKISLI
jgi:hypothetical protein